MRTQAHKTEWIGGMVSRSLGIVLLSAAALRVNTACVSGRLASTEEWFIATPATVLLKEMMVETIWEGSTRTLQAVIGKIAEFDRRTERSAGCVPMNPPGRTLCCERR